MKVLHVNDTYDDRGGVQQYLIAVARLLESAGHANAIVYRHQSAHTMEDSPWPAYRLAAEDESALAADLRQVITREQPDVAYIHQVVSPALVTAVAEALPAVAYVHGFSALCPGLAKYFRRGDQVCQRAFGWGCVPMHYLRRCSAALRPSTLARLMRATASLRQAYLHVPRLLAATGYMQGLLAQNGFEPGRIALLPPHFLTVNQIPPYTPPTASDTLLCAGRLEIEKGVPYLLHALSLLPDRVRLVVAGDGTLREECERVSAELGLAGRVEFLGWVDQEGMKRCYLSSALVVMPSIWPEPFGKVGIDSLAFGRPVVASAVGGIPDWLDDDVTGLLVRPADSTDLAAKISELLDDPARQQSMGRAGQRSVAERYAAHRHLSALDAVLRDAIFVHS